MSTEHNVPTPPPISQAEAFYSGSYASDPACRSEWASHEKVALWHLGQLFGHSRQLMMQQLHLLVNFIDSYTAPPSARSAELWNPPFGKFAVVSGTGSEESPLHVKLLPVYKLLAEKHFLGRQKRYELLWPQDANSDALVNVAGPLLARKMGTPVHWPAGWPRMWLTRNPKPDVECPLQLATVPSARQGHAYTVTSPTTGMSYHLHLKQEGRLLQDRLYFAAPERPLPPQQVSWLLALVPLRPDAASTCWVRLDFDGDFFSVHVPVPRHGPVSVFST